MLNSRTNSSMSCVCSQNETGRSGLRCFEVPGYRAIVPNSSHLGRIYHSRRHRCAPFDVGYFDCPALGQFPDTIERQLNGVVLVFSVALALTTGVLCGLGPALRPSAP